MSAVIQELALYLGKYIIFIALAVIGIVCGNKYKKFKMQKEASSEEVSE